MTSIAKLRHDTGKENQLELSCKRTKGQKTMVEKALISGINTTYWCLTVHEKPTKIVLSDQLGQCSSQFLALEFYSG